ncbi:hypothetical protein HDV03_000938 [Kappamyces sp. JEL0829]|nr:hypothetical protein HDV03_000938 [Kappamyces sp. JEL0829]
MPPDTLLLQHEFLSQPAPFDNVQYVAIMSSLLLCALGIALNFLLFFSLWKVASPLNKATQFLTINMAVADILNLLGKFTLHAIELGYGAISPPSFYWAQVKCQIQGFFHQCFASVSVTFMVFICIDPLRFLIARKWNVMHGPVSRKWLVVFAAGNWILNGLGTGVLPLISFVQPFSTISAPFVYHSSGLYAGVCWTCSEWTTALITILDAFFLMASPVIMVGIFGCVLYITRKSKGKHILNILAKRGIAFAIAHTLMWTYCLFVIIYEQMTGQFLPVWADRIQYYLAVLSCYANPIVVFILNKSLREPILNLVDQVLSPSAEDGKKSSSPVGDQPETAQLQPKAASYPVIPPRKTLATPTLPNSPRPSNTSGVTLERARSGPQLPGASQLGSSTFYGDALDIESAYGK